MSTWHDLVTASLLGTERTVVPAVGIPGLPALEDDTGDDAGDPAAVLLDRAALVTAARRAGRRPDRAQPLPVCDPDPRPLVSPAAARRLAQILAGEHPYLLTEWLAAASARGLGLPPRLLPVLLDRARRARPGEGGLARLVAETGGPRARWLATLNPDWTAVIVPRLTGQDAWRLGDTTERRSYLADLRARDPRAARELIAESWSRASRDRVMFLSVLADQLTPADEPLLDHALADPGAEVRARAAYLLASLPGSALGQRMAARARGLLHLHQGSHGMRLVVGPPDRPDALLQRDGIARHADRAHLVLEVLARTPLRTWTDEFGLTAAQIAALPAGSWAPVLLAGWSRAAIAQHDDQWMDALIRQAQTGPAPRSAAELEALRQLARRADPVLGAPDALPEAPPDASPSIAAAVLRFRYEMLKELDVDHGY